MLGNRKQAPRSCSCMSDLSLSEVLCFTSNVRQVKMSAVSTVSVFEDTGCHTESPSPQRASTEKMDIVSDEGKVHILSSCIAALLGHLSEEPDLTTNLRLDSNWEYICLRHVATCNPTHILRALVCMIRKVTRSCRQAAGTSEGDGPNCDMVRNTCGVAFALLRRRRELEECLTSRNAVALLGLFSRGSKYDEETKRLTEHVASNRALRGVSDDLLLDVILLYCLH